MFSFLDKLFWIIELDENLKYVVCLQLFVIFKGVKSIEYVF